MTFATFVNLQLVRMTFLEFCEPPARIHVIRESPARTRDSIVPSTL